MAALGNGLFAVAITMLTGQVKTEPSAMIASLVERRFSQDQALCFGESQIPSNDVPGPQTGTLGVSGGQITAVRTGRRAGLCYRAAVDWALGEIRPIS